MTPLLNYKIPVFYVIYSAVWSFFAKPLSFRPKKYAVIKKNLPLYYV